MFSSVHSGYCFLEEEEQERKEAFRSTTMDSLEGISLESNIGRSGINTNKKKKRMNLMEMIISNAILNFKFPDLIFKI